MSFNTDHSGEQEQAQDQRVTFNVGDRQYDVDSATKKITAADEHIQRLEAERAQEKQKIAELEAQLAASTKLEDALQKLKADNQESQSNEVTPSFDPETLSKAAQEAALAALQRQRDEEEKLQKKNLEDQTFKETQAKLAAVYGKDIDLAIQEKAGISVEKAMQMARDPETSKILLQIMSVDNARPSLEPLGSTSLNTPKEDKIFKAPPQTVKDILEHLKGVKD